MLSRRATVALVGAVGVAAIVASVVVIVAARPAGPSPSVVSVTVTPGHCAASWTLGHSGRQTFTIENEAHLVAEVHLFDAGQVVAEKEPIPPDTDVRMTATLEPGLYTFGCYLSGRGDTSSGSVYVVGPRVAAQHTASVIPYATLLGPNDRYLIYVTRDLGTLAGDVANVTADLEDGNLVAARADWLVAQEAWEMTGASYDSFGSAGIAIDGLPDGLPGGTADPGFTGLHRLEYGLWHGQGAPTLLPVAARLSQSIATLQHDDLQGAIGSPLDLPIRAHEILEDALRDHLSGLDDEGSGAAYPETYADLQATETVFGFLAPLVEATTPALVTTVDNQMGALQSALTATEVAGQWQPPTTTPPAARAQVLAAIDALLESLSKVPPLFSST